MAVVLLVRHGHSTANAEGRLAGWSPGVELTDRGRTQAAALGEALSGLPVVRVVSSPLERCLSTAYALAGPLEVTVDEGLGECRYGAWTGRRLTELAADPLWRTVQDAPETARFPESDQGYAAESLSEMAERVLRSVRRHDAEVEGEHGANGIWVAVTHGDLIKAVLADAAGAGVAKLQHQHVDTASVSVVRYPAGHPVVVATNAAAGTVPALLAHSAAVVSGDAVVGGGTR